MPKKPRPTSKPLIALLEDPIARSLIDRGCERTATAVAFVRPHETFEIVAGASGLKAIIVNFPEVKKRASVASLPNAAGWRRWQCLLCAFSYDEALGMPEEGIAPGTRWEDVPMNWTCPECGARKDDFEMVAI